jgi:serine/threonine protein kinase
VKAPVAVDESAQRAHDNRRNHEVTSGGMPEQTNPARLGEVVEPRRLETGQILGRYRVDDAIGRGAMGTVYRATDTTLGRNVALKLLEPEHGFISGEARARFAREARAAAALTHENVVVLYEYGEHEGLPFLAMELVVGTMMRNLVGDSGVSVPMRVRWLVEVARGLAAVHEQGLVHRDVKPENVLVSRDGVAKLADFGIVKLGRPEGTPQSFRTRTGQLVGTPDYMSPEQWATADVDARSDQYAWGLVAYELLTGRALPLGRPPPIQSVAPSLPDAVASVITRAIEHRREDRYSSMAEIIAELTPFAAKVVDESAITRSLPPTTTPDPDNIGVAETLDARPEQAMTPQTPRPQHSHSSQALGVQKTVPLGLSSRDEDTARRRTPPVAIPGPSGDEETHRRQRVARPVMSDGRRAPTGRSRSQPSTAKTFLVAVLVTIAVAVTFAVAAIAILRLR